MIELGIDVGSLTTKSVVLEDDTILSVVLLPTREDVANTVVEVVKVGLETAGLSLSRVDKIGCTGVGKNYVPYTNKLIAEARCSVAGVRFFKPMAEAVIDIGAESCRVTKFDAKGRIIDFASNDKCAAGTGIFLDTMAGVLHIEPGESDTLHRVTHEVDVTSTCVVFAESEVVSLIHKGVDRFDIWRGINYSMASRVCSSVKRLYLGRSIAIIGGVARNPSFIFCLEKRLGSKVFVLPTPQFVNALGAAIIAKVEKE